MRLSLSLTSRERRTLNGLREDLPGDRPASVCGHIFVRFWVLLSKRRRSWSSVTSKSFGAHVGLCGEKRGVWVGGFNRLMGNHGRSQMLVSGIARRRRANVAVGRGEDMLKEVVEKEKRRKKGLRWGRMPFDRGKGSWLWRFLKQKMKKRRLRVQDRSEKAELAGEDKFRRRRRSIDGEDGRCRSQKGGTRSSQSTVAIDGLEVGQLAFDGLEVASDGSLAKTAGWGRWLVLLMGFVEVMGVEVFFMFLLEWIFLWLVLLFFSIFRGRWWLVLLFFSCFNMSLWFLLVRSLEELVEKGPFCQQLVCSFMGKDRFFTGSILFSSSLVGSCTSVDYMFPGLSPKFFKNQPLWG